MLEILPLPVLQLSALSMIPNFLTNYPEAQQINSAWAMVCAGKGLTNGSQK